MQSEQRNTHPHTHKHVHAHTQMRTCMYMFTHTAGQEAAGADRKHGRISQYVYSRAGSAQGEYHVVRGEDVMLLMVL